MMPKIIDLIGQKFEMLTVVEKLGLDEAGHVRWLCECECGNKNNFRASHLRGKGRTVKSCGCLKKKHGMSSSRIYSIWIGMNNRCTNTNYKQYADYGMRGIEVCNCLPDFVTFYNWSMEHGYNDNLTIERIDVDGNYCICKDNLKWIPLSEQPRNTRIQRNNKSGVKGVYFEKQTGKWRAYITSNRVSIKLGRFNTIEDAIEARRQGEIEYWGKAGD